MKLLRWRGGLPVFWQTLAVLLFGLMIAQAVGVGMVFVLPPPRADFNRLSDVGAVLAKPDPETDDRDQQLRIRLQRAAPISPDGLISDAVFTHQLARRLGVSDDKVRLYYQPDSHLGFTYGSRSHRGRVPMRRHEPMFFGKLLAGVATPVGWRVVETPPRPLILPWQRRMMTWFAVGALALVPLAWWFARAISRQIRHFADAADRLGADPHAPPVAEEGAAELRVAARALNRMQSRVADYLSERTAMIGAIAHDLRTPLARIAFRVEAAPAEVRDKVVADVDQMQAMISAAMSFVRNTAHLKERVPVDLAALLRAIVEQDQDLGRAVMLGGIRPATVLGDPLALERLIQNLIDNGLAYGGAVEVDLAVKDGGAVLTVADRGPGLAPDMLERVFQPFARGDPSRNRETGGIGLGLTISRAIAGDHGGTLVLANRAGGGLEAVFSLPRLA